MSKEQLQEITEIIEDTIEYACNQWMVSGEKVWTVAHCLSVAKLAEFEGLVTSDAA